MPVFVFYMYDTVLKKAAVSLFPPFFGSRARLQSKYHHTLFEICDLYSFTDLTYSQKILFKESKSKRKLADLALTTMNRGLRLFSPEVDHLSFTSTLNTEQNTTASQLLYFLWY